MTTIDIGFYSKLEVSVEISVSPTDAPLDRALLECYLVAWFTLRQFLYLGHNLVVDAFEGLLLWDGLLPELMKPKPTLPPALDLLVSASQASSPFPGAEEALMARQRYRIHFALQTLQEDCLTILPSLVRSGGRPPKKRFIAQVPPHTVKWVGLGILGKDANYYVCHSIVALIRQLAIQHASDEGYLRSLAWIASNCATALAAGRVGMTNETKFASALASEARKQQAESPREGLTASISEQLDAGVSLQQVANALKERGANDEATASALFAATQGKIKICATCGGAYKATMTYCSECGRTLPSVPES